jgi:hypothetical protein
MDTNILVVFVTISHNLAYIIHYLLVILLERIKYVAFVIRNNITGGNVYAMSHARTSGHRFGWDFARVQWALAFSTLVVVCRLGWYRALIEWYKSCCCYSLLRTWLQPVLTAYKRLDMDG